MNCPLCAHSSVLYHEFVVSGICFKVRKCTLCSTLFQENLTDKKGYLYNQEYYTLETGYHYYDERKIFGVASSVWNARVRNIRKFILGGNFLDVGCAFGGLLHSASEFFCAVGLDVSVYAVEEAKKWNNKNPTTKNTPGKAIYDFFQGELLKLPKDSVFCESNFQVITMVEVAEHFSQPRESFEVAFKLLSEGGLLLIQTANFDGWQARVRGKRYHYFLPGHLVYYNAKSLKKTLREIGFRKFIEYMPVDFGLLPKLIKSQASFQSILEYFKWLKIIYYHYSSKICFRGHPLTSSYVLYAFK